MNAIIAFPCPTVGVCGERMGPSEMPAAAARPATAAQMRDDDAIRSFRPKPVRAADGGGLRAV
jgi:hypothetical protein